MNREKAVGGPYIYLLTALIGESSLCQVQNSTGLCCLPLPLQLLLHSDYYALCATEEKECKTS